MQLYLDTYDRTYDILHKPCFSDDHMAMRTFGPANPSRHSIVLVLLLISCVSRIDPVKPWAYVANSSQVRETVVIAIQTYED